MPKEIVNIGSTPNDGAGDPLRTAFIKTNANMDEIYSTFGDGTNLTAGVGTANYANVAGVASVANSLTLGTDLNVGVVTATGFISGFSTVAVQISVSAGIGTTTPPVINFTVAGLGATQLSLY